MSTPVIAFEEVELPRVCNIAATGGPTFQTSVIGNRYGVHQRNIGRTTPVSKWQIQFAGLQNTPGALELLRRFYETKYGMGVGFRFFPPDDHAFIMDAIGTGTGSQTVFPLYQKLIGGGQTIMRRICKPNNVAVNVYYNGVLQSFTLGTHYTIQTTTGTITFSSPPGNGVVITLDGGEFDLPVVFDVDSFDNNNQIAFSDWTGVGLVELLPINLGIT